MEPCLYLKYVLDGVLVVRARVACRPFFFCIGPQAGVLHSLSVWSWAKWCARISHAIWTLCNHGRLISHEKARRFIYSLSKMSLQVNILHPFVWATQRLSHRILHRFEFVWVRDSSPAAQQFLGLVHVWVVIIMGTQTRKHSNHYAILRFRVRIWAFWVRLSW